MILKKLAVIIASGLGSGFAPIAPGTWGSAVGILLVILLWQLGLTDTFLPLLIITVLITLIGLVSIHYLPTTWIHDDQRIVIDEVAGIFVTLCFVPISIGTLVAAFILFRIFDIWKPLGIRRLDRQDSNLGVMMDDVLAGVYSNISLQILIVLLPQL